MKKVAKELSEMVPYFLELGEEETRAAVAELKDRIAVTSETSGLIGKGRSFREEALVYNVELSALADKFYNEGDPDKGRAYLAFSVAACFIAHARESA